MRAIESLLSGMIDYARLYPPASLDMHTAARRYIEYSHSSHARALGRFVINLDRLPALREAASECSLEEPLRELEALRWL